LYENLKTELEILQKVDHPNLLKLHEVYRDEHHFHLVTEHCPGGELFSFIERKGSLHDQDAAGITLKLVLALKHLH
jgi:serine/threonine protein kinase